jgi:hypothetical protein
LDWFKFEEGKVMSIGLWIIAIFMGVAIGIAIGYAEWH